MSRLSHRLRLAFAAGCAERALPLLEYDAYPGGPEFVPTFVAAVEAVWESALGFTPALNLLAAREAIQAVFPEGDHYRGYDATVGAGAAIIRAVDAADDRSGRAAADVAIHVSSAYEQITQWNDQVADDLDWQEQAVGLLEEITEDSLSRHLFADLPAPPRLGAG